MCLFLDFRATLDLSLRHVHMEKKNQHDIYARKLREKERDLRNLKKTELQLKVSMEAQEHTKVRIGSGCR